MNHNFWLDAMLTDASRRRAYQRDLLATRRLRIRPRATIQFLLTLARTARASEHQAAARLRLSHKGAMA
ncbi:hypothetical protein D3C85_1022920 [compost metagenome]